MEPRPRYAVLSIDDIELAIPQSDVRMLESASNVEPSDGSGGLAGWIATDSGRRPVYCPDASCRALRSVPADRKICVLVQTPDGCFGLLCNEVRPLAGEDVRLHALPEAMRPPQSPLQGLLLSGPTGIALSDASAMVGRLRRPAAAEEPAP